jgi:hypothetical protein
MMPESGGRVNGGFGHLQGRGYRLACRAKPQSSNNLDVQVATTLTASDGSVHLLGGDEVAQASGLKPSLVRASGSWQ